MGRQATRGLSGEAAYDEIMMPLSLGLVERCDARFRASGRPVYAGLEEVPAARPMSAAGAKRPNRARLSSRTADSE